MNNLERHNSPVRLNSPPVRLSRAALTRHTIAAHRAVLRRSWCTLDCCLPCIDFLLFFFRYYNSANPGGAATSNRAAGVMRTPTLDLLAHEGCKLEGYYVQSAELWCFWVAWSGQKLPKSHNQACHE